MKFTAVDPPREFTVGRDSQITLKDCGRMELEPNEQVTFATASGTEFDVARKSWGYYATPSMNGRLREHNLRAALVVNEQQRVFLLLVEVGKESEFFNYLEQQDQTLVTWLYAEEHVRRVLSTLRGRICASDDS